jgi:hypothetical protein
MLSMLQPILIESLQKEINRKGIKESLMNLDLEGADL